MKRSASDRRRARREGILPHVVTTGPLRVGASNPFTTYELPADVYVLSNGWQFVSVQGLRALLDMPDGMFETAFDGCPWTKFRLSDGAIVEGMPHRFVAHILDLRASEIPDPFKLAVKAHLHARIAEIDARRALP